MAQIFDFPTESIQSWVHFQKFIRKVFINYGHTTDDADIALTNIKPLFDILAAELQSIPMGDEQRIETLTASLQNLSQKVLIERINREVALSLESRK